jgi:hypothetical protein
VADKNKLTVEQFEEIRGRRSQDDMTALLAHVQADLGIKDPPPEPSHADSPPRVNTEPQSIIEVEPTPPPAIPPPPDQQPAAQGARSRTRSSG